MAARIEGGMGYVDGNVDGFTVGDDRYGVVRWKRDYYKREYIVDAINDHASPTNAYALHC